MKLKKFIVLLLVLPFVIVLASCNSSKDGDLIEVGILQYLEHNALTEARKGFIDGLKEAGFVEGENIKIKVLNPETDSATMTLMSKELVRNSDLILAIATPAATSVVNEAKELGKDLPILFTAVTDPVEAKLIASNQNPGGNVTGTNDMNPIGEQIKLVKDLLPNSEKLGIIYTASETNSEIQAEIAKTEAEKLGLTVEVKTIESVNDLQLVANQLLNNVDALYIPTDNVIAGAIGSLNDMAVEKKVPLIVGEANMVHAGGSITIGVDYYNLGKETALMAVQILKDGKNPKDIPSVGLSEYSLIINKKQLDQMEITIPQALLEKADEVLN